MYIHTYLHTYLHALYWLLTFYVCGAWFYCSEEDYDVFGLRRQSTDSGKVHVDIMIHMISYPELH